MQRCPGCRRKVTVLEDGRLRDHRYLSLDGLERTGSWCSHSKKRPSDPVEHPPLRVPAAPHRRDLD